MTNTSYCNLLVILCSFCVSAAEIQHVFVDGRRDIDDYTAEICHGKTISCYRLARPLLERHQASTMNKTLEHWHYNEACRARLPPQVELDIIQYMHIPKAGTSINWFLRSYAGCNVSIDEPPCPIWLTTPGDQRDGLCGGRLFSCMGHSVAVDLPHQVLHSTTHLITLLRHPFHRLQSDFHHTLKHGTGHLGPNINGSFIDEVSVVTDPFFHYITHPSISNCMTKMLNGHQCGDRVDVTESHLHLAKRMLFVGITEDIKASICLFAWMYGGEPHQSYFRYFRQGSYARRSIAELTAEQRDRFMESEKFDLALYEYGLENFLHDVRLTQCIEK